mmetsp:Transcript_2403/g.6072  ORF Transcript_2403/g.6072 Transcript_2403/m.6072 type:complete len:240 (-) Transcript_2403:1412-2131(-)
MRTTAPLCLCAWPIAANPAHGLWPPSRQQFVVVTGGKQHLIILHALRPACRSLTALHPGRGSTWLVLILLADLLVHLRVVPWAGVVQVYVADGICDHLRAIRVLEVVVFVVLVVVIVIVVVVVLVHVVPVVQRRLHAHHVLQLHLSLELVPVTVQPHELRGRRPATRPARRVLNLEPRVQLLLQVLVPPLVRLQVGGHCGLGGLRRSRVRGAAAGGLGAEALQCAGYLGDMAQVPCPQR